MNGLGPMTERYCFLFDECLTPDLVGVANSLGFAAHHVVYIGRASHSDRALALHALENDLVFVTNNKKHFVAIYRRMELHPGLIVIVPSVSLPEQQDLFATVIAHLQTLPDLVNTLVEISADGKIVVSDLPAPLSNTPEI